MIQPALRQGLYATVLLVLLSACGDGGAVVSTDPSDYPDVLDLRGLPDSAGDVTPFALSDLGAWHMFGLPEVGEGPGHGGFTGPLLLTEGGRWVGRSLVGLRVWDDPTGEPRPWDAQTASDVVSFPGTLRQQLRSGELEATVDLIFVSDRSALVQAVLTNRSRDPVTLSVGWEGDASLMPSTLNPTGTGVLLELVESPAVVEIRTAEPVAATSFRRGPGYRVLGQRTVVEAGAQATRYVLVSAYGGAPAMGADRARRDGILAEASRHMDAQRVRWTGYLGSALGRVAPGASGEDRRIAVKAVQTLISNWRSPFGDLRYAGLFPSYAYRGFHGFWSWDSWKHARALALFAPELAKDQMRVMLNRQNASGMIPDVIYADSTEDNWRDTKPPLAAWAVAGIFDATADTAFVAEVYPALVAYHAWWYVDRDQDGDGLCEYGSTDGTRIAAAWESGMDNAVRFDSAVMVQHHVGAWSLNQESVDLNAYLFAEKGYLADLAEALGRTAEAATYRQDAEALGQRIRDTMFDDATGYFYDVRMETGEPIAVQGPEGWIPLWAGVATPEQARRVATVMMDPARFYGTVPLPTLSMAQTEFDPTDGYWRGPVWLDQAYFGVRGLERYGLNDEAGALRKRLLSAPEGLTNDGPIFENYDPNTGKGLNAPHFSWSAAHLLMLLDARDGERP